MKRLTQIVGACITAALLVACGGGNGLSSSTPMSVAQQVVANQSGIGRPALRHATSGANLYVANGGAYSGGTVTVYAPGSKSVLRTISQGLNDPGALAFDGSGNLYVANITGNAVTVYAMGGSSLIETISQGVLRPDALAFDSSGDLYVANSFTKADGFGRTVTVYAPGSTKLLRTITKGVCYPIALAFDSSGNLYVADEFQLAPKCKGTRDPSTGSVTVYAPGSETVLRTIKKGLSYPGPFALVFDASGNLYVANEGGNTVPVYAPGSTKVLRTISGDMVNPEVLAFDGSGNLFVANFEQYRDGLRPK